MSKAGVIEIVPHILKYIPKYQRPLLRFVSTDFKQAVDQRLFISINAVPENWKFVRTKQNVIEVKFIDFSIPYYERPLESTEFLHEISFCRITLSFNLHSILRKCNQIRCLTFSKIWIDYGPKLYLDNPILLPNLQVLRLETGESHLSKDDELLLDFLSKITYEKLEIFYICYSKPGDFLDELKLNYIWDKHSQKHVAAELIAKNKTTLLFFIFGTLNTPNILQFYENTGQLMLLSFKIKCPLSLGPLLIQLQRVPIQHIDLSKLPFELWSAALDLVQNCVETLTHVKLGMFRGELRDHPDGLHLAMFTGTNNLTHLEINLNFCRIYGISFLPKSLKYLYLKGKVTKFDLCDIANLPELEYLYVDLEEIEPGTGFRYITSNQDHPATDIEYMRITVDISILKNLVSMPKISKIILKHCIGYMDELFRWCKNEYNYQPLQINAEIRASNREYTFGNIDITVFP